MLLTLKYQKTKAMKTIQLRNLILLGLVFGIAFGSCKKDKDEGESPVPSTDISSSGDNNTAENMFTDLFKVVDDAAQQTIEVNKMTSTADTCAIITVLDTAMGGWPKELTIDFGTGCTSSKDFRTRKGKVIATFYGKYKDSGTVITVTTDSFFVNDYMIEGADTITNNGLNANSNLTFSIDVSGGKVTTPLGEVITWESSRTIEWIEGDDTPWPSICDDVYLINGSANGTNRKGRIFTVNITAPLRKEICCRHIVSGELEVIPDGLATRTIKYVDQGNCSVIAIVTVNGKEFIVQLP